MDNVFFDTTILLYLLKNYNGQNPQTCPLRLYILHKFTPSFQGKVYLLYIFLSFGFLYETVLPVAV